MQWIKNESDFRIELKLTEVCNQCPTPILGNPTNLIVFPISHVFENHFDINLTSERDSNPI